MRKAVLSSRMRILLSPFGTRGDVQPLVGLAHALRRAGHEVTFCAPPNYRGWLESEGFAFHEAGTDYKELMKEMTAPPPRPFRALAREVPRQFEALEPLVRRADVVIGASQNHAVPSLCEAAGVPFRMVFFSPAAVPSSAHAMPLLPIDWVPRSLNRFTWWLVDASAVLSVGRPINEARARLGLAPMKSWIRATLGEGIFLPFDPAIAEVPEDARHLVTTTGAWLHDHGEPLPPDVEEFLGAGAPPIYVGFGSMQEGDPARLTRMIVDAAERTGIRVLLSSGWTRLGGASLPVSVRSLGPVSHRALFPRCFATVHHGGAGTTIASAIAGVPQLIVPHLFDQFFHGRRIGELGLGPRALPKQKLTSEKLVAAFAAMKEPAMRERARAFAKQMTLDGADRAVRVIEDLQRQRTPTRTSADGGDLP